MLKRVCFGLLGFSESCGWRMPSWRLWWCHNPFCSSPFSPTPPKMCTTHTPINNTCPYCVHHSLCIYSYCAHHTLKHYFFCSFLSPHISIQAPWWQLCYFLDQTYKSGLKKWQKFIPSGLGKPPKPNCQSFKRLCSIIGYKPLLGLLEAPDTCRHPLASLCICLQ